MFYIEKIPLKQRIITGLIGAIICGGFYAGFQYYFDEFSWPPVIFQGVLMGLYFSLSLKWKNSKDGSTKSSPKTNLNS